MRKKGKRKVHGERESEKRKEGRRRVRESEKQLGSRTDTKKTK